MVFQKILHCLKYNWGWLICLCIQDSIQKLGLMKFLGLVLTQFGFVKSKNDRVKGLQSKDHSDLSETQQSS